MANCNDTYGVNQSYACNDYCPPPFIGPFPNIHASSLPAPACSYSSTVINCRGCKNILEKDRKSEKVIWMTNEVGQSWLTSVAPEMKCQWQQELKMKMSALKETFNKNDMCIKGPNIRLRKLYFLVISLEDFANTTRTVSFQILFLHIKAITFLSVNSEQWQIGFHGKRY